jgi:hypothetical protein
MRTYGQYRVAVDVSLIATQAADGTLFSMRWTDPDKLFVLQHLKLQSIQSANFTASMLNQHYLAYVARSFTASDSAGTAIVLTGNNAKAATAMDTSVVADMRKSAVAAGLTVGTRTLDVDPFFDLHAMYIQTTSATIYQPVFSQELIQDLKNGRAPIVLAANEGIVIKGPSTIFPAAGTANVGIDLEWAEVDSFDYRQLLANALRG